MIPKVQEDFTQGYDVVQLPDKTFRLNTDTEVITGYTDGIDAIKQAIYIILNVERYDYLIHSWNFGVELRDLFGKPLSYCLPEIKRRIKDALLQDSRITDVTDFVFQTSRNTVHVTFTTSTILGKINAEAEVKI